MKALLLSLGAMLREYLTSKKVLTAVLTALAGVFIKDAAVRDRVVAVGMTLIAALAVVDHGKATAGARAVPPAPPPGSAPTQSTAL
jgi:hypothetical protein